MDNRKSDLQTRRIIEEQTATIRLLTDLTKAGSWVIRYSTDGSIASVQWGNGFRRLMGYTDQSDFPDEIGVFLESIHPEERDAFVRRVTESVFDRTVDQSEGIDFRFRRKDGSFRWYRSMGRVIRDAEGRPLECHGVTIDITESREHDALYAQLAE